jgi:hypothetical protein
MRHSVEEQQRQEENVGVTEQMVRNGSAKTKSKKNRKEQTNLLKAS